MMMALIFMVVLVVSVVSDIDVGVDGSDEDCQLLVKKRKFLKCKS